MMIPRLLLKIYRFHKSLSIYILLSQMYKDFAQFVFFIKLILFFNFCDIMLYYNNSHGQNEVNQVKKKTLVPLITFLLGICLISLIVYKTDTHEKEQRHITAQLNVATYGEQIKNEITNGIEITDTLKQILISEDGEIRQFETIAGNLMSDSIESVQLAPNGVVTDIYPACSGYFFRFNQCTFKFWIRIQNFKNRRSME